MAYAHLSHPLMRTCISSFATLADRVSRMLRPTRRGGRHHRRPEPAAWPVRAAAAVHSAERRRRVVADVSEAIAAKVRDVAEHEGRELSSGTLAFIEAHIGRVRQPTLPLW